MFNCACRANKFLDDNERIFSVMDAYKEIGDLQKEFQGVNRRWHFLITRKIRSYFLETDIYIKHLERYMSKLGRSSYFKEITSKTSDENKYYAMSCILRNYIVHAEDIIHEEHWDVLKYNIWTLKSKILEDIHLSKSSKQIIHSFDEKIDILDVIAGSYSAIMELHKNILNSLLDDEVKDVFDFMDEVYKSIVLVNASSWFILKGDFLSFNNLPIDVDYQPLYWNDYQLVKKELL